MTGKRILAIIAVSALLVALVGVLALRACSSPQGTQNEESSSSAEESSTASGYPASSGSASGVIKGDGTHIGMSQVKSLESADWLTEEEKGQVITALETKYLAEGALDTRSFEIVGDHRETADIKELFIKDLDSGTYYRCSVGARYGLYELTEYIEGVNKPTEEEATATRESLEGQDQTSELNSTETEWDVYNASPLSYRGQVTEALPSAVSSRLMDDLNTALQQYGVRIEDPAAIVVSNDVAVSDDGTSFTILVYSNLDKIIINCSYDATDNPTTFEIMP